MDVSMTWVCWVNDLLPEKYQAMAWTNLAFPRWIIEDILTTEWNKYTKSIEKEMKFEIPFCKMLAILYESEYIKWKQSQ